MTPYPYSPVGYEMTDEAADALRGQVPDDPIGLGADSAACRCCGVAVEVAAKPPAEPLLRGNWSE